MRSVVKVSKTVDEAIDIGLKELDVNREDVHVEVLEEPSRGLFGLIGTKDAIVRITVTNDPVEVAEGFLKKMLSYMDIKSNCLVRREESCLFVDITYMSPSDMGMVMCKKGNTVDAIQYLLSLAVNKSRDDYIKIIVDIKGYRKRREETLIRLAKRMAEKAKYSKWPVKLEPMNPYERRIIHSALQHVDGVTTHSEGDDPYRRVVIQAK